METVPIIATVDLVSRTMDISIDAFDNGEIEEDGDKLSRYRFVSEDEVSMQCIDFDLKDTICEYEIDHLCQSFKNDLFEDTVSALYSWGILSLALRKTMVITI